jgi:hypothetical protein
MVSARRAAMSKLTIVSRMATCLLLVMLFATAKAAGVRAEGSPSDYEVKAAYLYQFGKFIEWPERDSTRAAADFSICVLGTDPFGAKLDQTVAGRTIQDKPVTIRRLSAVSEALTCNVLFISSSERSRLPQILKVVEAESILTVADMRDFVSRGGMIDFQLINNRVVFEVDLPAVERASLKISSQLLKVAKVITE